MENSGDKARSFKIGLVRLLDAAPYVLAGELGYFGEAGLRVELSWELGWATIKHKVAYGQLDAAQSLAPAALSIGAGLSVAATPCRALMVTSRMGNAITLSSRFRERGVASAEDFRAEVRSSRGNRLYKLGVVANDSCHNFLMRHWLASIDVDPENDVKVVVVPPGQAVRNLRAGTLDGYCVGEPWNTVSVREGHGWCPALSHELAPNHPEKILLARQEAVSDRPAEYAKLVGALSRACSFCDDPANFSQVARQMRRASNLGVAAQGMEKVLRGEFDRGSGMEQSGQPIIRFSQNGQTSVTPEDVAWIIAGAQSAQWEGSDGVDFDKLAADAYPIG